MTASREEKEHSRTLVDELTRYSGTQFDPAVVEALMIPVKIDPEVLVRTIEEQASLAPVGATTSEDDALTASSANSQSKS